MERVAAQGDVEAEAKLLLERVRAADLTQEHVAARAASVMARLIQHGVWISTDSEPSLARLR